MFVDSARITVRAGRGGDGCVSFRREKYVPRGGPNGGDGGKGGDVVLQVDANLNTLLHVHHRRLIRAESGRHGQGSNKTGAGGADALLLLPPGTVVRDVVSGEVRADLVAADERVVIARGGRGGRGNARFSSSTNRAPRHAEDGAPGEELELELELKLLADVGLVGMPNAGKSTLLSRVSAARPRIAEYPFTTLEPYLGVMQAPGDDLQTLVMADIPGLIEGAHTGAGLGIQFLRHIERCRVIAHLVDLSDPSPIGTRLSSILQELAAYSDELVQRPWLLVGTKLDAVTDRASCCCELEACAAAHSVTALTISAATGEGLEQLTDSLFMLLACDDLAER